MVRWLIDVLCLWVLSLPRRLEGLTVLRLGPKDHGSASICAVMRFVGAWIYISLVGAGGRVRVWDLGVGFWVWCQGR